MSLPLTRHFAHYAAMRPLDPFRKYLKCLHMGVIKAPLCNLRIGLARGVLGLEDIHRVADIF
jgi:hypothetical protein